MTTDLQNAWIERVLGVRPQAGAEAKGGATVSGAAKPPAAGGLLAMPGITVEGNTFYLNGRKLEQMEILALTIQVEREGVKKIKDPAIDGRRIWREAKETVDEQISELQAHLRATDDPDLRAVGEFGLAKRTKGLNTGLMKALAELGSAKGDAKAGKAKKALASVRSYRDLIRNDRLLQLLEKNPFGVKVSITSELDGALGSIEDALKAAA